MNMPKKILNNFTVSSGAFLLIALAVVVFISVIGFQEDGFLKNKFGVKAQISPFFFFPNSPQRLLFLTEEISFLSKGLVKKNEQLSTLVQGADCSFAESQCQQSTEEIGGTGGAQKTVCKPGPVKVFGTPFPPSLSPPSPEDDPEDPITIESVESEINALRTRLVYLLGVLEKEMEGTALEKQLATLRPDDAQKIRENLEKIRQLGPQLEELSQRNMGLPQECSVKRCTPKCQQGTRFELKACLAITGQHKPNKIKFRVGVGLNDLDIGSITVKDVNLSLPKEIDLSSVLGSIASFNIPTSTTLTCPTKTQRIVFRPPSTPTLPESPTLTLSCPNYPRYSSYQCSSPPSQGEEGFIGFQWWNKTFEHLSGGCLKVVQRAAELTGQLNSEQGREEYQRLITGCLSPGQVAQNTINECEKRWVERLPGNWYIPQNGDFEICRQIGHQQNPPTRNEKATEWCQKLFQDERQAPPTACSSEPVPTTRQKCSEIRNSGRENAPLSCKLLPLFAGQLEDPPSGTFTGGGGNCPSQKIGDFPLPVSGCEIRLPSSPKISFPTVVVPDIYLPTISLPPLFSVKLPNFIFEDLVIPDIDLCNLDACRFQFPDLSLKIPTLKIPKVDIPPDLIEIEGLAPIEIAIPPIQFPTLYLNVPQLINLASLATPELKIPEIPLPKPKVEVSFLGLDIDLLNLLLGLLKVPKNIPPACLTAKMKIGTLNLVYPDQYFSWPKFPKVPDIPICKDIRSWCQNTQTSIQNIKNKNNRIQKYIDDVFKEEIQDKLNNLGVLISEEIKKQIQPQLKEVKARIEQELLNHLARYAPGNIEVEESRPIVPGTWRSVGNLPCEKIPPLSIPLDDIEVGRISLQDTLRRNNINLPTKIPIDWPEELKKVSLRMAASSNKSCQTDEQCTTTHNVCYENKCFRVREVCYDDKKCGLPLSYDIPPIPLSELSWSKEITKELPGFQLNAPTINLNLLQNPASCLSQKPEGGNPCPTGDIQRNLEQIQALERDISEAFKELKKAL